MNKEHPLISIIVPMYNCAEYAPKCVENIINQTYPNWELWLVHGDSNDGTKAVCQAYEDQYPDKIHNIYHIDGLVQARNVGYEHATGDWIMYIDGDDWIDVDTCEKCVNAITHQQDMIDVVFWISQQELNGNSIEKFKFPCDSEIKVFKNDECVNLALDVFNYLYGFAASYGKLIRSEYAKKYKIEHDRRLRQGMEGVDFALRCFYYAKCAVFVKSLKYHYRYNPASLSKVVSEKNALYISQSAWVIAEDIFSFEKRQKEFLSAFYRRLQYAIIAIAMSTYFHTNNKEAYNIRKKKFNEYITDTPFFAAALFFRSTKGLDFKRRLTLFFIKHKINWPLQIISMIKMYLLKIGKFNY